MGEGPESRIPLNTSSKKTFRSLLGATGRFLGRPESGDSAKYFLQKNFPVAFQAAGKSQYRVGLPPNEYLGVVDLPGGGIDLRPSTDLGSSAFGRSWTFDPLVVTD